MGWKTDEKMLNSAKVTMELLEKKQSYTPFQPETTKEIRTLIFEIPEQRSDRHLSHEEREQLRRETGIKPQLKKPDLRSSPNQFTRVDLSVEDIKQQVIAEMEKIAQEVFDNESCTSRLDVAGRLSYVAKYLRALSLQQLKEVESQVQSRISSRASDEQKKVLKALFYDVVAMIGTNPAVMLVRERLRDSSRIEPELALRLVQTTFDNIKTPTQELLRELIHLVKNDLKSMVSEQSQRTKVFNMALVHLSNVMYKACVDRSQAMSFPVHVYGYFCQPDSQIVQEFVQWIEQEIEQQQDRHIKLNLITALGKMGTLKSIRVLSKIVSQAEIHPMVRSLAVYSMKRAARLQPVHVKPILLSIIDNAAEEREVRMAAVAVLPFAQPSTAELQKIAVRTWLEPSKEVASFIYSTLRSLVETEVPELKLIGQKVKPLMTLVKPFEFGFQYSKNLNIAQWISYLNQAISQKWSYVKSRKEMLPVRQSLVTKVISGSYELTGMSWTLYTEGMDRWAEEIMRYTRSTMQTSSKVRQELSKITQKLNIEQRVQKEPLIFMQSQFFEMENEWYLNQASLMESLNKLAEELEQDSSRLTERRHFNYVRSIKLMESENYGPSDAGFPLYTSLEVPVVMAFKGYGELKMEERFGLRIPKMLKGKVIPVVNLKMEAIRGVVSPFTQELLSVGVEIAMHYATPLEMTLSQESSELSLDIKMPEEVANRREVEALHLFITPFTVQKNLKKVGPPTKESSMRTILSGAPLKQANYDIGRVIDMAGQVQYESDAKFVDLYSYIQKIKQQNIVSLLNTFYLPSTIRKTSARLVIKPQESRTKEITLTLSMMKLSKMEESSELKVESMAGLMVESAETEVTDMHHIQEVCKRIFSRNPQQFSDCVFKLSLLEEREEAMHTICQKRPYPGCQRKEHICMRAFNLCEQHYRSTECRRLSESCLERVKVMQSLHKSIASLEREGSVVSIHLGAKLRSESGSVNQESATRLSVGLKKETSETLR